MAKLKILEELESINTTLGEEDLSTTSQNVKGAINEVLDNTVANTEAIENIDLSQYRGIIRNIDEMVEEGTYYVAVGDKTFPYHYGMVVVSFGNEEIFATFQTSGNDVKYYYNTRVLKTEGLVWQGWKELATTDNTIRTYKSLVEINPTFTENTPLKDVMLAMKDNSMAMYSMGGGVYPSTWGVCTIYNTNIVRNKVEYYATNLNVTYTTSYHSSFNPNCEWKELVTQTKTEITSSMLKNGWTLWGEGQWTNSIITTGENLSLNLMLHCGDLVEGTVIMEGLPIRTTQSFVSYTDNNNKQGLLMYCTDGTLIITTYGLPTNSVWITVDDVINI